MYIFAWTCYRESCRRLLAATSSELVNCVKWSLFNLSFTFLKSLYFGNCSVFGDRMLFLRIHTVKRHSDIHFLVAAFPELAAYVKLNAMSSERWSLNVFNPFELEVPSMGQARMFLERPGKLFMCVKHCQTIPDRNTEKVCTKHQYSWAERRCIYAELLVRTVIHASLNAEKRSLAKCQHLLLAEVICHFH